MQLWLSDTAAVVCESFACGGPEFAEAVHQNEQRQNPQRSLRVGGYVYHLLNEYDLAEFGALAIARRDTFHCECDRVYYDAKARELVALWPATQPTEGTDHG